MQEDKNIHFLALKVGLAPPGFEPGTIKPQSYIAYIRRDSIQLRFEFSRLTTKIS
jgi:hypothetical protein